MPTQSPRLSKPRAKKQLAPKHASADYKSLYNWKWRKASVRFLRENPLCACDECAELIVPKPATVTDHIIPHKGDYEQFWNRSNWQPMNKRCHDHKTAKEDGGFGR